MVGYKLSKNDWVTPFFVIFRSVREILLVTVFFDHPVAPKLLPSLLQAHQPIIWEAHQPLGSRPLGQVARATLTDHNNKTQTCILWKAIQRAMVYKQTQTAQYSSRNWGHPNARTIVLFFVTCMVKYKSAFHVDLVEHIVYANCSYYSTYLLFNKCAVPCKCLSPFNREAPFKQLSPWRKSWGLEIITSKHPIMCG